MKHLITKPFARDYIKLPERIQTAMDKQIKLLLSNPKHPSLNIKKMKRFKDIWEARVTGSYRFAFHIEKDTYILRRVGTHDILKNP